ncbi:MAG: glycosyltransferase family 2 protein [Acidimicrobiales bacterium]
MTVTSASVVVITFERPDHLARCLEHLERQATAPWEIIVVDSSVSDDTEQLVGEKFPSITYRRTAAGRGAMATVRNMGYEMASGDVIAFVDDDAYAEPDWLTRLLVPYDELDVGAVGGRQIRRQPGELTEGLDAIGRLLPDGTLTGNFAADPGRVVTVDHLLGANMSFRRRVLDEIGGIRDGYFGTCVREESDLCLRVARAGYRLLYAPDAVVEHVAAPYNKGRRFDLRYQYWSQKNHVIYLVRNFGANDPIVRAFLRATARSMKTTMGERLGQGNRRVNHRDARVVARSVGAMAVRGGMTAAGTVTGLVAGMRMSRLDRRGIAVTRHR